MTHLTPSTGPVPACGTPASPAASPAVLSAPSRRRGAAAVLGLAVALAVPSVAGFFGVPNAFSGTAFAVLQNQAGNPAAIDQARRLVDAGKYQEALDALADAPANDAGATEVRQAAQRGITGWKASRSAFADGESAMDKGDALVATTKYQEVLSNPYADAPTRQKSQEQLNVALLQLRKDVGDADAYYRTARGEFDAGQRDAAGTKFRALQAIGYNAPALAPSPGEYLRRLSSDQPAGNGAENGAGNSGQDATPQVVIQPGSGNADNADAAPAASEPAADPRAAEARSAYASGIAAYQNNNFETARAELARAQSLGYTPGLFESDINDVLIRMAQREAADKADADRRTQQPTPVVTPAPQPPVVTRTEPAQETPPVSGNASPPAVTPGSSNALQNFGDQREVQRQQITYQFNEAVRQANEALQRNDFTAAKAQAQQAQAARQNNPQLFSNSEQANFDRQLNILNGNIASQEAAVTRQRDAAARAEAERLARENADANARSRADAVTRLRSDAQAAVDDGNYEAALSIIDQVLTIDPQDPYAVYARPFVQDRELLSRQAKYFKEYRLNRARVFADAGEKRIPYSDILRYPENWPDLVARRDRTVSDERGDEQRDAVLIAQLEKPVGVPLAFNGIPFEDVVTFLRSITNASIVVNYQALELAGVDRNTEITLNLGQNVPLRKALQLILDQVGGGFAELGYTVDEGVITISSRDDLNRNVETQVVDIRDLIVSIPEFNIDDADYGDGGGNGGGGNGGGGGGFGGGGGGGGGGFGGGGGGGGFGGGGGGGGFGGGGNGGGGNGGGGNGGNGGGDNEGPSREELVQRIIDLITTTVATDSWQVNGGNTGRIAELNGQLVVTQTGENLREVVKLLSKLRETRAIQVNVETRFLTVQRNFLEDVGVDLDFIFNFNDPPTAGESGFGPVAVAQNSTGFTQASSLTTGIPGSLSGTFIPGASDSLQTQFTAFLDNFRANILLRATQQRADSQSLTAPNITLFNGQRAFVLVQTVTYFVSNLEPVVAPNAVGFRPQISSIPTGVRLEVQATVSADRRYVTLTVHPTLTRLQSLATFPVSTITNVNNGIAGGTNTTQLSTGQIQQPVYDVTELATTVSVPDGGTLLLGGQTLSGESSREAGVPILSKVPFLKRLFTNTSKVKDEQVLLILIKPTIILQKEIESETFPLLAPAS